ncbi:hypothetical protein [Spiroplasma endosymbiont of Polydrusus formosus]|uniref:hypothetical protein n=1 Tax=Spiroplasma endosymbiont of Polydrusus formosus TaxID=3139326 RepID=UPI0035B56430
MSKSSVYQWIEKFHNSGFFKAKDNRTVEKMNFDCLAKRINLITNEKQPFKASVADNWQKIEIINNNKNIGSVAYKRVLLNLFKNNKIFYFIKMK